MNEEYKDDQEKRSKKSIYIIIGILCSVTFLTVLSFTNPYLLIGWYLDKDIENKLLNVHESRFQTDNISNNTINDRYAGVRFTFENDLIVDSRVNHAIEIFNELFKNYEREHKIQKNEETTTLELKWSMIKQGES